MATFDKAIDYVLVNEGNALLDDSATTEYSRYGITLRMALCCRACEPGDRSYIDNLNVQSAMQFYQKFVWVPIFDGIRDQDVATKLFDMVVNMGNTQAIRLVQRACNVLGATLSPDGIMGHETLTAINSCIGSQLVLELCAETVSFYRALCTRFPDKFGKYWETWKARGEKRPL